MGTEFEGSRHVQDWAANPLELSKLVNQIVGTAETLITRPGDEKLLVLSVHLVGDFDLRPGDYLPKVFTGDFTGGVEEDIIIVAAGHNLNTGDGPYKLTEDNTLPSGLADFSTLYFVRVVNATTLTLHLTRAAAVADTGRVDLVDDGTSTNTLGGMPAGMTAPAATTTDGYTSTIISGSSSDLGAPRSVQVFAAPTKLTVIGSVATARLSYWFLP